MVLMWTKKIMKTGCYMNTFNKSFIVSLLIFFQCIWNFTHMAWLALFPGKWNKTSFQFSFPLSSSNNWIWGEYCFSGRLMSYSSGLQWKNCSQPPWFCLPNLHWQSYYSRLAFFFFLNGGIFLWFTHQDYAVFSVPVLLLKILQAVICTFNMIRTSNPLSTGGTSQV